MAFKMAPKSPAKMGQIEATVKAKAATFAADKLKATNAVTSKYNEAKQLLRNKVSETKNAYVAGRQNMMRAKAASIIADAEKSNPSKYKSVSAKPVAKKPEAKKTESKPIEKTTPSKPASNNYEKANKGGALDKLVAIRNSAKKGSAEYNNAQNSINKAMGSKVVHKSREIAEAVKAPTMVEATKPEIKADIKIESPAKKKYVEKKTGEKYASKAAMMKHEKSESKAEMKKEYGKKTPAKMKKC